MRIGIDLGGSHIGVGIIEEDRILETRQKNFTDEDRKDIKNVIIDNSADMINELLEVLNVSKERIELVGVASPGIISNGTIITASNLGIENFELSKILQEKLKVKVNLRNDAKCAALVEKKYGSLKSYDDTVFIGIGTGIGGAVFLDGKLLKPKKFEGFEIGHMIIEAGGIECPCGKKGCFERYASIKSLKQRVTSILGERGDISGQYLRENLLIKNDERVQNEVERFLNYLKIGIGNLIDLFEPEAICLGGSFSYYEGNPVLDRLIKKINENDTAFTVSKLPDIVTAKYKNDAGIIGATL